MKPLHIAISVLLVFVIVFAGLPLRPAQAAQVNHAGALTMNCSGFNGHSATIRFNRNNAGGRFISLESVTLTGKDGAGTTIFSASVILPLGVTVPVTLGTYRWSKAPKYNPLVVTLVSNAGKGLPAQTVFTWTGACTGLPILAKPVSAAPTEPPPPKWFDPGDIRVDGWAGDRLAVYCRSEKEILVIGIGQDGNAAGYALFKSADVIAAGKPGLSAPLRSYKDPKVDLGVVTIQMVLNDGVTSLYVAWNGGILNASGQGDFKKMFVTPTRFCPFTFR